jgi:hypothetical protein
VHFTASEETKVPGTTVVVHNGATIAGATGKYFDTNCKEQPLHKTAWDPAVQRAIMDAIRNALGDSTEWEYEVESKDSRMPGTSK